MVSKTKRPSNAHTLLVLKRREILTIDTKMISKNDVTTLPLVRTNIELIWSFSFLYHLGIYDEDFILHNEYGYLTVILFSIPLGSIYHARILILRQNHPSINMV